MKQHLAKSLLMAGAMLASCPLFAQQAQPNQPTQPMPSIQPAAPAAQPMQGAQAIQAAPAATIPAAGAMPASGNTYAQTAGQPSQPGMASAPIDMTAAGSVGQGIDPASMRLAPDALGTRLGQRSPFLDGA
ncbi:hypothetical protein [Cupriavidus pinatubonensis]|uniref:hypothetical protein n=1 Tax=Cupriavidus pinatubonensis TaxID=248026 RepID=UPI003605C1CD